METVKVLNVSVGGLLIFVIMLLMSVVVVSTFKTSVLFEITLRILRILVVTIY